MYASFSFGGFLYAIIAMTTPTTMKITGRKIEVTTEKLRKVVLAFFKKTALYCVERLNFGSYSGISIFSS